MKQTGVMESRAYDVVAVRDVKGLSDAETRRARIDGYIVKTVDGYWEKAKARQPERDYQAMMRASMPADDAMLRANLAGFPADWAGAFARSHKLVGLKDGMGEIVPRVPYLGDLERRSITPGEFDVYSKLDRHQADKREAKIERQDQPKTPKYFLSQFLTDAAVVAKFGFSPDFIAVVSRMAVVDPAAACSALRREAHDNGFVIAVAAGDYAQSRKAARARLLAAASGITLAPYDVVVLGTDVMVTGKNAGIVKSDWTIRAALWQMPEVDALHRIAFSMGVSSVGALFTMDMIKLGISFSVEGKDYGLSFEHHLGDQKISASMAQPGYPASGISSPLYEVERRVFPVMAGGKVVATALAIERSSFYVNWHVIDGLTGGSSPSFGFSEREEGLQVADSGGSLHAVQVVNEIAPDVWVVELADVARSAPALFGVHAMPPLLFRQARVGEKVVLVYATSTNAESSDVSTVARVERGLVITDRFPQARAGLSGAAMIALDDMAVVAVYSGSNEAWSMGSALGSVRTTDWVGKVAAVSSVAANARPKSGAAAVYSDFVARGLQDRLQAVASAVDALYSGGRQVGLSVVRAHRAYTAIDPTLWDLTDSSGVAVRFEATAFGGFSGTSRGGVELAASRLPVAGEMVLAVYRDEQGIVFSDLHSVGWVSDVGDRFRLSGVPRFEGRELCGAVLVALSDAAAVGVCQRSACGSTGEITECFTWESCGAVGKGASGLGERLLARLTSRFPLLGILSWPAQDYAALDAHDQSHRRLGVAAATSSVVASLMRDNQFESGAGVAARFEDDEWLDQAFDGLFPGASEYFGGTPSDRARFLKGFFGLVYLREGSAALSYVLDELGLVDSTSYSFVSMRPALVRRPSSV